MSPEIFASSRGSVLAKIGKAVQSRFKLGHANKLLTGACSLGQKEQPPSAIDWLQRITSKDSSSTKDLFLLSAAWHLSGLKLLKGNPVALPILGKQVFFAVSEVRSSNPEVCLIADASQ